MSLLQKGKKVIITIETVIQEVEPYSDFDANGFNNSPFIGVRYGDGYTLELPQYKTTDTVITVTEPKTEGEE